MTFKDIENIYNSIESIKPKCSLLTKIKLSLYNLKLKEYKDLLDSLKKDYITENIVTFEQKKMNILNKYKNDAIQINLKINELINSDLKSYESYLEAVKNIEIIYSYECEDIPKIALTMEEIPDDIDDLSESTIETIFELISDSESEI